MKIAVAGIGRVGLSIACILSRKYPVTAVDIDCKKVELVNERRSPIADAEIHKYLASEELNLTAVCNTDSAYKDADYVIVCTPTNYDENINHFDTSSVESVIRQASTANANAIIIIKSTVPVGFTEHICEQFSNAKILFCPEFLREGRAIHDNLYPGRIIVGIPPCGKAVRTDAEIFTTLLNECSLNGNADIMIINSADAEAVKLFANTYLAMRVAFFNELDTYACCKGLDSKSIIKGIGLDPRIGLHYNNPSFGYGGYCLPKDTKQLLTDYGEIPQRLISAIVDSNAVRKSFVVEQVSKTNPKTVGIYRIIMKSGSDNYRQSAVLDIMHSLDELGIEVIIYEPTIIEDFFENYRIIHSLDDFKNASEVVLANRNSVELDDIAEKVYTRDLFSSD